MNGVVTVDEVRNMIFRPARTEWVWEVRGPDHPTGFEIAFTWDFACYLARTRAAQYGCRMSVRGIPVDRDGLRAVARITLEQQFLAEEIRRRTALAS